MVWRIVASGAKQQLQQRAVATYMPVQWKMK